MIDNQATIVSRWENFFGSRRISPMVIQLEQYWPEQLSLKIAWEDLLKFDDKLADGIRSDPTGYLTAGRKILAERVGGDDPDELTGIPVIIIEAFEDHDRVRISDIRPDDLGRLVCFEGTVKKSSEVLPRVVTASFRCAACRCVVSIDQDDQQVLKIPIGCLNAADGGCGKPASATTFKFLRNESIFVAHQMLEIHQRSDAVLAGEHPHKIIVELSEDQVEQARAGDDVVIVGIPIERPRIVNNQKQQLFDMVIDGISIQSADTRIRLEDLSAGEIQQVRQFASEDQPLVRLRDAFAPSLHGLEIEKTAVILQLFGGVSKIREDGIRLRGDIHLLLVGDPGTGKSQLLDYAMRVAPHAAGTSGKGATAAGLTAAAVKGAFGGNQWGIEAGVMVLADGGLAVVDELDKLSPEDSSSMHPAMEQQKIRVSKAGLHATYMTRCAVLMAANPTSATFDPYTPTMAQIDIPSTLFSRFDLIFPLFDEVDSDKDRIKANHILVAHAPTSSGTRSLEPMDVDFLRRYLVLARSIDPVIDEEVRKFLADTYQDIRGVAGAHRSAPVTLRQLEALARLSQACARVRLSDTVSIRDAQIAADLVATFLNRIVYDPDVMPSPFAVPSMGLSRAEIRRSGDDSAALPSPESSPPEPAEQAPIIRRSPLRDIRRVELVKIIDQMVEEFPLGGVSRDAIVGRSISNGFSSESVESRIGIMLERGQLMETAYGLRFP